MICYYILVCFSSFFITYFCDSSLSSRLCCNFFGIRKSLMSLLLSNKIRSSESLSDSGSDFSFYSLYFRILNSSLSFFSFYLFIFFGRFWLWVMMSFVFFFLFLLRSSFSFLLLWSSLDSGFLDVVLSVLNKFICFFRDLILLSLYSISFSLSLAWVCSKFGNFKKYRWFDSFTI